MSKPSAIAIRKANAEMLVKNHFGDNYAKVLSQSTNKQLMYRLRALVIQSCKSAGLSISKADLDAFVTDILSRADARADKAREDYIYGLTRRSRLPIYGASAVNAWMLDRLRSEEGAK